MSSVAKTAIVAQRALHRRADPRYFRLSLAVLDRYKSAKFPLVAVSSLLTEKIAYGTSAGLTTDPPGVPILRMSNLTPDGIDTSDVKYLESDVGRSLLQPGDVLVNRTNSDELVGKAAVFDLPGDWGYASYLLRLRVDRKRVDPRFLVHFLNSAAGRMQVARVSRRAIGMANINTTEIGDFLVPLPSLAKQRELLEPLDQAWSERTERKADAAALLAGINDDLAVELGLLPAWSGLALSYATTQAQARSLGRLGVQFFHPERASALHSILASSAAEPMLLDHAATFVSNRVEPPEGTMVLGLSGVESHTGEVSHMGDTATAAKAYEDGDVLYCRLRPYLNKVARMSGSGLCSSEFYVLRPAKGIDPTYLSIFLRSRVVLAQTSHLSTGNTHPRVAEEDARSIVIAIPVRSVQARIRSSFRRRRVQAHHLRQSASDRWDEALTEFTSQLL